MKLAFDFDPVRAATIYAGDDPEYMTGRQVDRRRYELTEQQKHLQRLFLGIIYRVRQYDVPVNVDNLLEAIRDYFQERSTTE